MAYRPTIQLQLSEPITGRYDCTAYSAAMAADAQTRGAIVPTGRQVRLASDEPVPSPRSPGLNIHQVDAALYKLSGGKVDLDVAANGSTWAAVPKAAKAGQWIVLALWRGVLVDAGIVKGFRAGHAVLVGAEEGKPIVADPLESRWLTTTWAILEEAARQNVIRSGGGAGATGAYYGITSKQVTVRPPTDPVGEDALYNIAPLTSHRDVVLRPGTVLYRDSALTVRHSAVAKETPLGFLGSGPAYHVVGNSGNTNYVSRADALRIVPNDREYV